MKGNEEVSVVAVGAWEGTKIRVRKEGLRSAAAYADSEVRRMLAGGEFTAAQRFTQQFVSLCIKYSGRQSVTDCIETLKRAKETVDYVARTVQVSQKLFRLMLLTCNNLALVLQSQGDPDRASWYLECAEKFILAYPVPKSSENLQCIASTKVNLSTLLIIQNRYQEAVICAEDCLKLLRERLTRTKRSLRDMEARDGEKHSAMMQCFVCAMFNVALAEERLGNRESAIQSYTTCLNFVQKYSPQNHRTISEIQSALSDLSQPATDRPQSSIPCIQANRKFSFFAVKTDGFEDKPMYYTQERLRELHELIVRGEKRMFVTSNQFFSAKVEKMLKLDTDVRHLTPLSRKQLVESIRSSRTPEPDPLQRSLSHLRQRKYRKMQFSSTPEPRGAEYVQARLSVLSQEPSLPKPLTIDTTQPANRTSLTSANSDSRKRPSHTTLKQEIEELMGEVQGQIKTLSPQKKERKIGEGEVCQLAASVRKVEEKEVNKPLSKLLTSLLTKADSTKNKGKVKVAFQLQERRAK